MRWALRRDRCLLIALSLVLPLGAGGRAAGQAQPPAGMPDVINEAEGQFGGIWTWDNGHFNAVWVNGAIATITVQDFTGQSMTLNRKDVIGSSAGLTAVYTAQSPTQGGGIQNGYATFTWPGHFKEPPRGAWTGTWGSPNIGSPPCGDPSLPASYDTKNPNYHHYVLTSGVVCTPAQSAECTPARVFQIMLSDSRSVGPVVNPAQKATSCGILMLIGFGSGLLGYTNPIKTVIDNTNLAVTNLTMPGHVFYPGQVVRQVLSSPAGVSVITVGTGSGPFRQINVDGAVLIFRVADAVLKHNVRTQLNIPLQ